MQNEITELRNQVRTLKRIVYGFGCLLVAGVVVSATSVQTVPDVIQAKRFEVLSDNGNAVVVLDSHIRELGVLLKEELHYGSITTLNSQGGTLVTLGANPCFGTGQLMTMNAHGRLLVKVGAEFQKLRYGVVGNGGLIETYQENGTVTSYSPSDNEQTFRDPYNLSTQTEQRCCQNPHNVECIVNTTASRPGSCQHAHHLECGVDTID